MNQHYKGIIREGGEPYPNQQTECIAELLAGILLELAEANRVARLTLQQLAVLAEVLTPPGYPYKSKMPIEVIDNITPGAWGSQATAQEEPRP